MSHRDSPAATFRVAAGAPEPDRGVAGDAVVPFPVRPVVVPLPGAVVGPVFGAGVCVVVAAVVVVGVGVCVVVVVVVVVAAGVGAGVCAVCAAVFGSVCCGAFERERVGAGSLVSGSIGQVTD
ncbi:hypothetical protein M6D93_06725 [Jatrophihabitans telluris]|uniref:Uncharacterized protein n=1 Tax=Jatrophihabitans telluris TaxID=2038343 RepID=A0ABY4R1H7_9ACTN|nr:hypothetical protein [Jatrophihabitans telluris]UQX89689.1 hypothetical protein M6D93_06725 [Jatrophihabitans telluris]